MNSDIFKSLPVEINNSVISDGVMKYGPADSAEQILKNRRTWLEKIKTSISNATLLRVSYGRDISYDRILDVDKNHFGEGMMPDEDAPVSDALFTATPKQVLFLPLADCGGVVLFDTKQKVLGLLHLGRHSTFDGLAEKSIRHMEENYGSRPKDIYVWVSPAISGESYWLERFNRAGGPDWQAHIKQYKNGYYVDLQGYNKDKFIEAGISKNNIERSPINTATHPDYPSHYAYQTLQKPEKAGRFALAVYITA